MAADVWHTPSWVFLESISDFLVISGVNIFVILVNLLGESWPFGTAVRKVFIFLWGNGSVFFFLGLGVLFRFSSNFVKAWRNFDIKALLSDCGGRGILAHLVPSHFVLQVQIGWVYHS